MTAPYRDAYNFQMDMNILLTNSLKQYGLGITYMGGILRVRGNFSG